MGDAPKAFHARSGAAAVLVVGWGNRTGAARLNLTTNISDYRLLFAEIV